MPNLAGRAPRLARHCPDRLVAGKAHMGGICILSSCLSVVRSSLRTCHGTRRWPVAVGQHATYRVGSSSRGHCGADEEFRVARYGGTAVTDAGRDAATAQLREHYAAGRLSLDQFQDRLDEAYRAQTARELNAVTDGLPHVGQVISSGAPWGSYPGGYPFNFAGRRAALARTGRRIMLALGVLTAGSLLVLTLLIAAFLVHGGLLSA